MGSFNFCSESSENGGGICVRDLFVARPSGVRKKFRYALSVAVDMIQTRARHFEPRCRNRALAAASLFGGSFVTQCSFCFVEIRRRGSELRLRVREPHVLRPDRARALGENYVKYRFVGGAELGRMLERVKGLLAHTQGGAVSMVELMEKLCDIALTKSDKSVPPRRSPATPKGPRAMNNRATRAARPAHVKREPWRQAHGKCQNCDSQHALEIDHLRPVALGGGDDLTKLRLLRRPCNAREANNHALVNR